MFVNSSIRHPRAGSVFSKTPRLADYREAVVSPRPIAFGAESAAPPGPNRKPLISVITVVYNGAAVLERTIVSVISQSYSNVEYLVIDGGSTDGSLEIVRKYEDKIALWTSGPDTGIADAMNKGIANARGEIVNFLNAGDYYIGRDALALVAKWYGDKRWSWAYGLAKLQVNHRETNFAQKYRPFKKYRNYYVTQNCHQATFLRRDLFRRIGLHSIGNDRLCDIDLFMRASEVAMPETSSQMIVWYDTTGLSAHVSVRSLLARIKLTLSYCGGAAAPLWIALIMVRWVKSALGLEVKRLLIWRYNTLRLRSTQNGATTTIDRD